MKARLLFAFLTVLSALGLVYASFLPITPRSVHWPEAVAAFRGLPWLNLGLYNRADWIANALVVLPAGFFAAAAVDYGRASRIPLLLAMPLIAAALVAMVCGIEFAQVYFPPRTRSLNDVAAGSFGAVVGPLLWLAFGRLFMHAVTLVRSGQLTKDRIAWAAWIYVAANLLYAALPLDVVLTNGEWQTKVDKGLIVVWPDARVWMNPGMLKGIVLAAVRAAILAMMMGLARGPVRGFWSGVWLAIACELIQIPIFTRTASTVDVGVGVVGAALGVLMLQLHPFAVTVLRHAWVWFAVATVSLVLIVASTLGRSVGFVKESAILEARWEDFWGWPFAKYYFTSEFEAGSNVLAKLGVFAVAGFCLCSGVINLRPGWRWVAGLLGWLAILSAASFIEIAQVYLLPHVPDASDILIYVSGALLGWSFRIYAWPST